MSLFIVFGSKFLFYTTRAHSRSSLRNLNFTFSAFFHDRSSKFSALCSLPSSILAIPMWHPVWYLVLASLILLRHLHKLFPFAQGCFMDFILIPFYFSPFPCWTYPSFSRVQGILWSPDHRKENKDTLKSNEELFVQVRTSYEFGFAVSLFYQYILVLTSI